MKTEVLRYNADGSVDYEQGVIVCACNDFDHSIIYWKQEHPHPVLSDVTEREVYLGVSLKSGYNFWERLKYAYKYLFKKERYGMYGEILVDKENISGFEDIVNFINEDDE